MMLARTGSPKLDMSASRWQLGGMRLGSTHPPRNTSAAAAAAGQPQQPPLAHCHRQQQPAYPSQGPAAEQQQQHQQQQQHRQRHRDFEDIKTWQVKRTPLHQYPDDVAQRIRSSEGSSTGRGRPRVASPGSGGGSPAAAGSQARWTSTASGPAAAGSDGMPAAAASVGGGGGDRAMLGALAADLDRLGAALDYERRVGFINCVGSVEKVPVAEFALRRLLAAAEQLAGSEAAHACVAAAQKLRRYGGAAQPDREAAVAAAEEAVRQAQLSLRAGGRTPAARQGRHQSPGNAPAAAAQQAAGAAHLGSAKQQAAGAAQQAQNHAGPRQQHQPVPAPAAQQQQQQQQQQPAAAGPAGPAMPAPAAGGSTDQELDAAAEAAHAEETGQPVPTPAGEEYVLRNGRRMKAATAAFRDGFAEAAAALAAQSDGIGGGGGGASIAQAAGGEQRSEEWFRLRERRLTASAFSKALGLFEGDRQQLWAEKVGMVEPFAGNAATAWGTSAEPLALCAYQAVTGQRITSCMFQVKRDDPVHGWLGASPDGLIESLSLDPAEPASPMQQQQQQQQHPMASAWAAAAGLSPQAAAGVARGTGPLAGPGRGILEIKCPHNKGQPELAVPPQHATWYYMPQVQGLMYIFDCEWCNLYIWTPQRGSAVYHVQRDRAYWARLWGVLADFWWNHVVPARQEFAAGRWEEVEQYRPPPRVPAAEELRQWSKRMAVQAPVTFFRPQPHPQPPAAEQA